jgi:CRISPR/Cas system CSM-associated protein Csm4 (group 5 of RAMP superfamily)
VPEPYTYYRFRLRVLSPVAADSPFDSDTLWGRLVCALMEGPEAWRGLGQRWLNELQELGAQRSSDWQPPLLVSEGFPCDNSGIPWLPLPLAVRLQLEERVPAALRKEVKRTESVPLDVFARACQGNVPPVDELVRLRARRPCATTALHPHLAMNRASTTGVEGMLFISQTCVYSSLSNGGQAHSATQSVGSGKPGPAEINFFLKLRGRESLKLIESALRRICDEGWGSAKSRGLGRLDFKGLESWQPATFAPQPDAFVSLSSFCPAAHDPTEGYWKLDVKNPVPAQFVDKRRVVLGEDSRWRVKSFLRLRAGSCFRLRANGIRNHYGRMLSDLLEPAEDAEGNPLPALFHYALAFPVPMRWPEV